MANAELSNALRDFPNRVINVGMEERPALFANVSAVLTNPGINSAIIRGICKVIGTTLTKYKDPSSQQLVRRLISDLAKEHHDITFEYMLSVLKTLTLKELPLAPVQKSSKSSVIALSWIALLLKNGNAESNIYKTEKRRLFEYQSLLYQMTLLASQQRVTDAARKVLYELWEDDNIFSDTVQTLLQLDPNSNVTILIMLMVQYENQLNQATTVLKNNKDQIIEYFVKSMILSKTKPQKAFIVACYPFLKTITDSEFELHIYPPLQRNLLRSPENTLESLGLIIDAININCSRYGTQIGKILIQNLYSKDEVARRESLESLKTLSQKCSDEDVIKVLLEQIFSILSGSDGKINVVEYRLNLLQLSLLMLFWLNSVLQAYTHINTHRHDSDGNVCC
ncbi:eIF-2-alpha kinase activator GCN1 isoform X2 [Scaptodrosophila lebanonensis]|uniref:EIF-2-alpha kinase activator GCN1 isoform X2 n=1 Tax=Drosophila lebanonensis TaxID=7225 RepID=A0A6J2TZQ6_DROLE|nr:eIF-2-alpha kinase activator GCN1 isoform X2 [Scaptodrosophila lebanonensis]